MGEDEITNLLMAGRSGGEATAQHKVTGRTDTEPVPVPDVQVPINKDVPHSTVSAEIEWAPNLAYSKVSIRAWASRPCAVGQEAETMEYLKSVLHNSVQHYVDDLGIPVLQKWENEKH